MEFEFNLTRAKISVFSFVISSLVLVFLLFFLDSKVQQQYIQDPNLVIAILAVYFTYIAFLIYRTNLSKKNLKVKITEDELIFPNYHLGEKRIDLEKIFSIEERSSKNHGLLILGIRGGTGIFLDSSKFKRKGDFLEFKQGMGTIVERNNFREKRLDINDVSTLDINRSRPYLTWLFSFLCVFIFCLSLIPGLHGLSNEEFLFLGVGKKSLLLFKDWYRFFSSSYNHVNIFHLLINLFIFSMLGEVIEEIFSPVKFVILILASSLIAHISFVLFSNQEYGAGFSGSVFGLLGGYLAVRVRYEKLLPGRLRMVPLKRIIFFIALEFIFEILVLDNVEHSVHLAGFVTGFLYLFFSTQGKTVDVIGKSGYVEKYSAGILSFAYLAGLVFLLFLVFQGEVINMPGFT